MHQKSVFYPPKIFDRLFRPKILYSRFNLRFLHNKVLMISNHYLEINLLEYRKHSGFVVIILKG